MPMFGGAIEDHRPLAGLTEQVNPHKIMQYPAHRRMLNSFTPLVGTRCRMVVERLTNAVFHGGIHQQTHGHHHQQGHDALRLFQIQSRSQKLGVFQASAPALHMYLAFVALPVSRAGAVG